MEVGELPPQEVKAGDIVLIPPMCRQRITNIGPEDLIFLAICTPRFSNDVYEDIEDPSEKQSCPQSDQKTLILPFAVDGLNPSLMRQ